MTKKKKTKEEFEVDGSKKQKRLGRPRVSYGFRKRQKEFEEEWNRWKDPYEDEDDY